MEAPGIEYDQRQKPDTIEQQSGTIGADADSVNASDRAPECAIAHGVVTESSEAYELSNVVETALARALLLAAEAARWDIVGKIAAELEGRRTSTLTIPRFAKHRSRLGELASWRRYLAGRCSGSAPGCTRTTWPFST